MKNKILSAATFSTILASSLLMSGVALADTHKTSQNDQLRANVGAGLDVRMAHREDNDGDDDNKKMASSTRPASRPLLLQGNGQPVVGGTVTAVGSSTLTLTTSAGAIVYIVNTSGAVIVKGHATTSLSSIAVGDKALVQGTINGTTITASSVIDNSAMGTSTNNGGNGNNDNNGEHKGLGKGIFGRIQGFFHNFFGFF